jgi:hypothetical protein
LGSVSKISHVTANILIPIFEALLVPCILNKGYSAWIYCSQHFSRHTHTHTKELLFFESNRLFLLPSHLWTCKQFKNSLVRTNESFFGNVGLLSLDCVCVCVYVCAHLCLCGHVC